MIYALMLAKSDDSGMPTTWPGTIATVAFFIFMGFIAWLAMRD